MSSSSREESRTESSRALHRVHSDRKQGPVLLQGCRELRHKHPELRAGHHSAQESTMVWSRDPGAERPPLSMILPRLYLGAESDVTQERLASLGISYVVSVSRCSPQPSFLPCSRYLRIPIDDSLWDDLLPWIPQALHFLDAAMSSGASVLVHCAAGISRSPALAVAYVMYSRDLDLDQAYRFVKERRPSISPNFNFLGQLQHFQGALSQRAPGGDFSMPPPPADGRAGSPGCSRGPDRGADRGAERGAERGADRGSARAHKDSTPHTPPPPGGDQQHRLCPPDLSLCPNQRRSHNTCQGPGSGPPEPLKKPTQLQLPSAPASLLEKRRSLTLSLTPLGTGPAPPTSDAVCVPGRGQEEGPRSGGGAGGHGGHGGCRTQLREPGLLSPLNVTLNKLLGWGERLLLGGLFAQPVRMGTPALPYRC
ncbi:dual specificity protein phosphatase 8 [Cololabis saira]|uniref:dual specificity protein phosphatase 8 n=1 Tax=Cololabis saira TaxID=129043 RepID=UPI002AD45578|nr:dual specificity protein phosphatase 8 [Cololabis saira]